MATETLAPDALPTATNLTGAVTAIDEPVASPDANWLTATVATTNTDARVTFPTPTGAPTVGANLQKFRAWLRKTSGTPNPTIDLELWENAGSVATLLDNTAISSTTGEVVEGTWNASLLGTANGSLVECRIASAVGGTPGAMPAYSATGQAGQAVDATITTTINPAKPSTVNAGDLLILHVHTRNESDDGAGPASISGWTSFSGNPYGGANHAHTSVYWRIAGAGEASQTVAVTCTGGTTNDLVQARIYRFTAADGFDVTPVEAINWTAGIVSPMAAPTVTPTGTNRRAVCLGSIASSDAAIGSMTGETGGDWIEAITANTTSGADGTINVQTSDQSGGGAISGGSIAFTLTTSPHWVTVGFALVPANIATNTVEIGAVEWLVDYTAAAAASFLLSPPISQARMALLVR